jgi:hypothetical protein
MDGLSHERREWLPAYMVGLQVVTTLLLGVRLLSRITWRGGGLGLDDFFITLGWAVGTANTGVSIYGTTLVPLRIWVATEMKQLRLDWVTTGTFGIWTSAKLPARSRYET